jgi:two-component system chemotaxis response regulator CheB
MNYEAVVIGASAGGLGALRKVLSPLPAEFRLPIMIVQHRAPSAVDFLSFPLNNICSLTIKEADDKDVLTPGFIYIAPANYHLLVEQDKTLSLSIDPRVRYARPSVDVLFETAAEAYRSGLIGIILTGANDDGTAGLRQIKAKGGLTIAQDPATAEAEVMPRAAIRAGVVDKVLSLSEISTFLSELTRQRDR